MAESPDELLDALSRSTAALEAMIQTDRSAVASASLQLRVEGLVRHATALLSDTEHLDDGVLLDQLAEPSDLEPHDAVGRPMLARDLLLSAELVWRALRAQNPVAQKPKSP